MALQLICNFALILGKRTQERVQKFDNDESNSFFSACAGPEIVSRRWGWGSVLGIFEFAMGRGERFRGIFFSQFYQFKKLYFFKAGVLTPSHTPLDPRTLCTVCLPCSGVSIGYLVQLDHCALWSDQEQSNCVWQLASI